jgi:hypothetical protein
MPDIDPRGIGMGHGAHQTAVDILIEQRMLQSIPEGIVL